MKKLFKSSMVLLASLFSLVSQAKVDWNPCQQDLKTFCPQAKLGSAQAYNCLKEKVTDHGINGGGQWTGILSMDCNQTVRHAQFHDICKKDIEKYCADVKPGSNQIHDCMKKNIEKITSSCGNFLREYLGITVNGIGASGC